MVIQRTTLYRLTQILDKFLLASRKGRVILLLEGYKLKIHLTTLTWSAVFLAGGGKSVLAYVALCADLSFLIHSFVTGPWSSMTFSVDWQTMRHSHTFTAFRNPRCTTVVKVFRSLTKQLLFKSKHDWLSPSPYLMTRKRQGAGLPTTWAHCQTSCGGLQNYTND
jgi:hypothetical protein